MKIDCLGDMCPIPVLKLNQCLEVIKAGEKVMIVTDHSCATNSIFDFSLKNHLHCQCIEVMNGVWEIEVEISKEID